VKRSDRMQTLLKLAGLVERASRLRLAQANTDLHRKEQQQRQLTEYQREYAEQWIASGKSGLSGAAVASLSAFRANLAAALAVQDRSVATAHEALTRSAEQWTVQRNRQRVFNELLGKALAQERRELQKRLQRDADESSAVFAPGPRIP